MKVVRVEILGKVENVVCRILRSFSTGNENGFDVHDEQGKLPTTTVRQLSLVLLKQEEKSADDCNQGYVQICTPMTMDTPI
jgi:hypothetical protein